MMVTAEKVLFADDEERIRSIVRDFFELEGYTVLEAADGQEALDLFYKEKDIALVILDVMMPEYTGWEVCKEIRRTSDVPVIFLTALDREYDELKGFQCGADEYIAKPFSPQVLLARVQAILRRTEQGNRQRMTSKEIEMDIAAHIVRVDGEAVDLSVKEFDLLKYFMQNPGIALSREMILSHVWEFDYLGDDRTIDTHVKKLRSKLGKYGNRISTVWGIGYKFEA